jgi:hypothetical protein
VNPPPAAQGLQPVNISCTRGFPDWLLRNNVSLAFTSYQTSRLYLVGVNSTGQTAFHERFLARAMGLWTDPQRHSNRQSRLGRHRRVDQARRRRERAVRRGGAAGRALARCHGLSQR